MKYIKKVILKNFQSHKYTEIELDSSLNVIVGPSDQGKSAIIRGIKWALFNEPSGDYFIREGEKECSVSIIFSDNTKVKRYRSSSKNTYYLYDSNGSEEVFEGFGTTVPQEIIDKTGIRKVPLDGSQTKDINIGEQLEGPFLLSDRNASRANAIGRLVGVHIIDDALKDTLKDIRNLNIKRKSYEENLENLQVNLKQYDYLDDLTKVLKQIENIRHRIHNKKDKVDKLSTLLHKLNKINEEIKVSKYYLDKLGNINKVEKIEKELIIDISNYNATKENFKKLNRINKQMEKDRATSIALTHINKIEKFIDIINKATAEVNKLNKLYISYKRTSEELLKVRNKLTQLENIDIAQENHKLIKENYIVYGKLVKLGQSLNNINKSLSVGMVYTDKLKHVDRISHIEKTIINKNARLKELSLYKSKYDTIIKEFIKGESIIRNLDKQLKDCLEEYEKVLNKVEICPLCFSQINKSKIEGIINTYK